MSAGSESTKRGRITGLLNIVRGSLGFAHTHNPGSATRELSSPVKEEEDTTMMDQVSSIELNGLRALMQAQEDGATLHGITKQCWSSDGPSE